jgi:hypothetical protein
MTPLSIFITEDVNLQFNDGVYTNSSSSLERTCARCRISDHFHIPTFTSIAQNKTG